MGLVDYSDSDDSENETQPQQTARDTKSSTTKQSFQKVVDRSNPSKIKVSLPAVAPTKLVEKLEDREPPPKKQRTGGGGLFSGLNSFLPAPKKSGAVDVVAASSTGKKLGLGRGLGSGVSLRTGATPAFSREALAPHESMSSNAGEDYTTSVGNGVLGQKVDTAPKAPEPEVKLVGNATRFRPLSVARKNQKKKRPIFTATETTSNAPLTAESSNMEAKNPQAPAPKPKVSLFSMAQKEEILGPVIQKTETIHAEDDKYDEDEEQFEQHVQPVLAKQDSQTLGSIASELNLDEAARRQLFGRRSRGNEVPINLVNFDTDKEYTANEELRASGEAVQHKALRTVAPGKHSLRQLVTAAATQKDALEESWAAGRRNKKEAGSKYGW